MAKHENLETLTSSRITTYEMRNSTVLPAQDEEPHCPHRAMWRAVITQALMDAGSNSKKREMRREKARAIAWLHSDSDDFNEVCIMADLEPGYVKRKAKEAIKNGCKWRIELNPMIKQPV